MNVRHKEFGARGDHTQYDDTNAFKRAIAACPVGGVLYVPPSEMAKSYGITDVLTLTKSMTVLGCGSLSNIQQLNASKQVFLCDSRGNTEPSGAIGVRLERLQLVGGTIGIEWRGIFDGAQTTTAHLIFAGQTFAGMGVYGPLLGTRHRKLSFQTAVGHGLYVEGQAPSNGDLAGNTTWENCDWSMAGPSSYGVWLIEPGSGGLAPNAVFDNCIWQTCKGSAFRARNYRVELRTPHFEANGLNSGGGTIYEDIHLEADGNCTVYIYGGVMQPSQPQQTNRRVKYLSAGCQLFTRDLRWGGGSANIIDAQNFASCYTEMRGFGNMATVINGIAS